MIKQNRINYLIIIFLIILLGILSRVNSSIPTFFGDILYAVMIYFGMHFLLINFNSRIAFIYSIIFCYSIEFSQLYQAKWIVTIRETTLGHYALGQGFLWSDLGYYLLGVFIAFLLDLITIKKN